MLRGRFQSEARRMRTALESCHPQLIQDALPAETIDGVLDSLHVKFRRRLYTPVVTMWLWLGQVFSADRSIRKAVARAFGWLLAGNQEACSTDCSPYSRARNRLPEAVPKQVAQKVAEELEPKAIDPLFGRRVWLFDGTTCQAADTEANQKEYPQPPGQKTGCGFPMVRLVGMFSLVTGALRDLAIGSYYKSEHGLFRALWDRLQSSDIVVADSLFNSYANIALLAKRGVDVLFRQDQRRKFDFRRGKRLGPKDALFVLRRPPASQRPKWMTEEEYLRWIPETQLVRVLEYTVKVPGFRPKKIRLLTTLLDAKLYPAELLAELYAQRWRVEVDINVIKTTLEMEFLNVQSPEMIRKEIWMHMLGYNLIRKVMWDTSAHHGRPIEELSFKGTLQLVTSVAEAIAAKPELATEETYQKLLKGINQRPVRRRPNRSEPRVVKRRNNKYTYMTKPRGHGKPRKKVAS